MAPVDLPLFALHTVLLPGGTLGLHVFEERYLQMLADVLPDGRFVVAAIRQGREVGGPADPYRVGVVVRPEVAGRADDGAVDLAVVAEERVRLLEPTTVEPYPRWLVEPFPEEGSGDPRLLAEAVMASVRYLKAAGVEAEIDLERDAAAASYELTTFLPGLVPDRQAMLEVPGSRERLTALRDRFRLETGLLSELRRRRGP